MNLYIVTFADGGFLHIVGTCIGDAITQARLARYRIAYQNDLKMDKNATEVIKAEKEQS